MFRINLYHLLIAAIPTLVSVPLAAASFDCAKARTRVENTICNNSQLNEADEQLGKAYLSLRKLLPPAQANALRQEQRTWLEQRDSECLATEVDCLTQKYEDRIAMLTFRLSPRFKTSPASEVSGRYTIDDYMFMSVKPLSENRVFIEIGGAEPVTVRWICNFSGAGFLEDDVVTVYPRDGVTPITFTFDKENVAVKGEELERFCGFGGNIGGQYVKTSEETP